MKRWLLLLSQLCLATQISAAPEQLFKPLPADVTPQLSQFGDYTVGVKTVSVTIEDYQNPFNPGLDSRPLTLEAWYPAKADTGEPASYINETRSGAVFELAGKALRDASPVESGQYPVIVISHGYTGYRTIMFHIAEHLASHGYIVVGIDHTDSTNADVDFSADPGAGFLSTLVNRSLDQQFVLDWALGESFVAKISDAASAGLIGYSMGGYGAINTIGGCYAFTEHHVAAISGSQDSAANQALAMGLNQCAARRQEGADPRWKAAVLLAPWGGQHQVFAPDSLAKIKVPSLYIAGDLDDISGYSGIHWLYEQHQLPATQILTYHYARHNIAPHPAPAAAMSNELDIGHYWDATWDMQALAMTNQHFTLAMMNCHVKQSSDACKYLAVRGSSNQHPIDGKKPDPWIGFDDRYSTGMSMQAKQP